MTKKKYLTTTIKVVLELDGTVAEQIDLGNCKVTNIQAELVTGLSEELIPSKLIAYIDNEDYNLSDTFDNPEDCWDLNSEFGKTKEYSETRSWR